MIYELLTPGEENAMRGKDICLMLRLKPRDLTSLVERERRQGKPICASTGKNPGYFLARNKGEMERYCASLRHRAGEIFATRRACQKMIDSLPGEAE